MASLDEWKKFLASKPETQREYRTVEFFHPDFTGVQRFVKDFQNISLTLESDAPRNPSTAVLFTALAMDLTEPSENQEAVQLLSVSLGATGGEMQDQLNLITVANKFTPVECIYRKYYSGDLSSPVLVLNLSISEVSFEGYSRNNITAEDQDFASKPSGEFYTLSRFPTLRNL